MPLYSKESIAELNERLDLVEVISPFVALQKRGAAHKGLCPFHTENTPSFVIQQGERHYHCFGCGAHGDAIAFLMQHQSLSFGEAVERLAEMFQVSLETAEPESDLQGSSTKALYIALEEACRFYHAYLLRSVEGKKGVEYLTSRGLNEAFVQRFNIGFAPSNSPYFLEAMTKKGIERSVLELAGLLRKGGQDFFQERLLFPITNPMGRVIGFSGRKIYEETYGGKYINTPETPLFKKSKVLFGFHECRRNIAKQQKALIVEGQIDALRLIHEGIDITVAGQGTAFGEGHARELFRLGVRQVFLAFDGDRAGREAAFKVGNLFQSKGVEVKVLSFEEGGDPDSVIQNKGVQHFLQLMDLASDYISFLVRSAAKAYDLTTPAGKSQCTALLRKQISAWEDPVMVHEGLKQVARLLQLPEESVGIGESRPFVSYSSKKTVRGELIQLNPDRILESDFLRWLILYGFKQSEIFECSIQNLKPEMLKDLCCRALYARYLEIGPACDTLSLATTSLELALLEEILTKKINAKKSIESHRTSVLKILERNWMDERDTLLQKMRVSSGDKMELMNTFSRLSQNRPTLKTD